MFNDKYKQYQQPNQTVNTTNWQVPQWHQSKEEYYSHISSKPSPKVLTEQEVNDLFWNVLVNLGWRRNTENGNLRLVFACPQCEMIIDDCPYDKLLMKDANVMRDKNNLDRLLIMHNGEPCFPVGDSDE